MSKDRARDLQGYSLPVSWRCASFSMEWQELKIKIMRADRITFPWQSQENMGSAVIPCVPCSFNCLCLLHYGALLWDRVKPNIFGLTVKNTEKKITTVYQLTHLLVRCLKKKMPLREVFQVEAEFRDYFPQHDLLCYIHLCCVMICSCAWLNKKLNGQ